MLTVNKIFTPSSNLSVSLQDKEVVGYCNLYLYDEDRLADRIQHYIFKEGFVLDGPIAVFSISVSHKCRGYGKKLIQRAAEEARLINLKGLLGVVDLERNNPFDLTEWYLRRGFEIVGRFSGNTYSRVDVGFPVIYMRL